MAYVDAKLELGIPAITNSTARTASTNIYNAGADVILFGAESKPCRLWFKTTISADDNATILVNLVASGASDLDADNGDATKTNDILASSGTVNQLPAGTGIITTSAVIELSIPIQVQWIARQYYGLLITLGGTNPDCTAGDALVLEGAQTNMVR